MSASLTATADAILAYTTGRAGGAPGVVAMATDHPPERFVLALGHSDWGAGQLESELVQNAWLVAEPDDAIIFGDAHDEKWGSAIRQLGVEPIQIMGDAGRA